MSEPRHRKVTVIGIASLVATGRHEVLDRLSSEICNMWLDVFAELREATNSNDPESVILSVFVHADSDFYPSSLVLFWDKPTDSYFDDSEGSAEYNRLKAVSIDLSCCEAY